MKRPQVYELEYFTNEGELLEGKKHYMALQPDLDREVQFMDASQRATGNPHNYTVRVLRSEEVRELIKIERREQRAEARQRIWRDVISRVAEPGEIYGMIELRRGITSQYDIR